MALEFSQKIQQIKEAVNIVDLIGQYLKLNRKGNNFWAICPFHQDSNPSLSISQEKQIYKCFSCGEQGNVFIFLQKYKNIDFYSALKEVAIFAKLDLQAFDLEVFSSQNAKLHPFKVLNNLALNFYQYQLTTSEGKQALEYLKQRNITDQNINDFLLGYAPNNNQLIEYLKLQGNQQIDLIESGLAKINDKDEVKDMFFNRIIFPIIDLDGNCLGFSARKYLVQGNDSFKYINTPETEIFKKGKVLYNLYNAKKAITANNDFIYLVEGYIDVISLSNQNINNVVAIMGTNLTKEHINILKKITNNLVVFLDGDEPGKLAAIKIATNLLMNDFNVKVINNPTNLDPDELITKNDPNFSVIIADSLHPLDFAIAFFLQKYDLKKDSYQLKNFLAQLKPLWRTIKDPVTLKFYLESLKKITNLTEQELFLAFDWKQNDLIEETSVVLKPKRKDNTSFKKISLQERFLEVQKQLFYFLLLDKSVYLLLEKEKFIFYNKELMNLSFLVAQKYQEDEKLTQIDVKELLSLLKDNQIFAFLQSLINQYQGKKFEINQSILQDNLKIIKNCLVEIEIEGLNHQITTTTNLKDKIELLQKKSILKNKLNE